MEKLDKVKAHLKENRKVYIAAGVGIAVGVVATVVVLKVKGSGNATTVVRQINYKSNPVTNIVTTNLARRGHPGNLIMCNETGEVFASQQRAADLLGLSAGNLSQHLKGNHEHVGGFTFTYLGEAS